MDLFAARLADRLIQNGADSEKKDIYQYAIELTLSTGLGMTAILILGAITIGFRYGLIFLLFFIPLRCICGGYHASTYRKCFLISCEIFICSMIGYRILLQCNPSPALLMGSIAIISILIIIKAPILNVNQPLTAAQVQKNKRLAIAVLIIDILLILILFYVRYNLAVMAEIAIAAVYILMLPKKGEERL